MIAETSAHILKDFDKELARLTAEIAAMGEQAARQLEAATDALVTGDDEAAAQVIEHDALLNHQEQRIGEDVLRLLALRQPLARDLREVLAALRISVAIERIGDYAANIARRARTVNRQLPPPSDLTDSLAPMWRMATHMVREVMRAWTTRDALLARAVWESDNELDRLYTILFRELLTHMMADPRNITPCTHLLFIAKHIERVGDHATNIAEDVWFAVRGDRLDPPRGPRDLSDAP